MARWLLHHRFALGLLGLLGLLAGCAPEGSSALSPEALEPGKSDNPILLRLEVQVTSADEVRLREDSATPLPGAPEPLTDFVCGPRFTWDSVQRVECKRGTASLEVLYRPGEKRALTIFRPKGRSSDQRSYATCTTTSTREPRHPHRPELHLRQAQHERGPAITQAV